MKALHASQQNSTHGDVILPNVLESPTLKGAYRKLAPHDEAHLQLVISRQQGLQLLVADRRRLVGARRLEQISDDDLRTLGSCGLNANRVAAENTGVTAIICDFRTIEGERRLRNISVSTERSTTFPSDGLRMESPEATPL